MIPALGMAAGILAAGFGLLAGLAWWRGLALRQLLLYAPLKFVFRIRHAHRHALVPPPGAAVFVIAQGSRLDPAIMLCLLLDDTLHILDETSAKAKWLQPWRDIGRTIPFNPSHIFFSRRLVRLLKGGGRIAVYLPAEPEPSADLFRLYRAVARIAARADAPVITVSVTGAEMSRLALKPPPRGARRRMLPTLKITTLPAVRLRELQQSTAKPINRPSLALFDRMAETRLSACRPQTVFEAVRDAALERGPNWLIAEDPVAGILSYRALMVSARLLAWRFTGIGARGDAIGVMLPNSVGFAATLIGLASAGRSAAILNHTTGATGIKAAIRTAGLRTVISSREFAEKTGLDEILWAIDAAGVRLVWIEDIRRETGPAAHLLAALLWRWPVARTRPEEAAVILFTSGSEDTLRGVVLSHRNLWANIAQLRARIALFPEDVVFNPLPPFHAFGLTAGMLLPLAAGLRVFLYPSPLHARIIAHEAARIRPTVMIGTDNFLGAYGRAAEEGDFAALRLLFAGGEPVHEETRRLWRERFGADILEGYVVTETGPVAAINTMIHRRPGTVGRLLPGMKARVEPVEGIAADGRLWLSGPNVMLGYLNEERPGEMVLPPDGWHDTGDIVSFDAEGYITILGRAGRFAQIAAEMVSLAAVEAIAHDLWPEEQHAAVALPDAKRGERIVLATTAARPDRNRFRRTVRARGLSPLFVPDRFLMLDEIPVLGSGKTDYGRVRQIAAERADEAAA